MSPLASDRAPRSAPPGPDTARHALEAWFALMPTEDQALIAAMAGRDRSHGDDFDCDSFHLGLHAHAGFAR
jgi:hypothetical protein